MQTTPLSKSLYSVQQYVEACFLQPDPTVLEKIFHKNIVVQQVTEGSRCIPLYHCYEGIDQVMEAYHRGLFNSREVLGIKNISYQSLRAPQEVFSWKFSACITEDDSKSIRCRNETTLQLKQEGCEYKITAISIRVLSVDLILPVSL